MHDFNFVSDMDIVLCKLTEREGHNNLAMMYRKDLANNCFRVSFQQGPPQPDGFEVSGVFRWWTPVPNRL